MYANSTSKHDVLFHLPSLCQVITAPHLAYFSVVPCKISTSSLVTCLQRVKVLSGVMTLHSVYHIRQPLGR